jgi:hypothetical protein
MLGVSVVKPQYGPTMPALVRRLPPPGQAAVVALVALLVAAAVVLALRARPDETNVVVRHGTTFNLTYGSQLRRARPARGALLALRRERGGLFLDSYVVRPLMLAPYRGAVSGVLPVYSVAYMRRLRKRYGDVDLVLEGRTRINNAIGYQLVLRGKLGRRTLYVRHLLLVPDEPEGQRRGVVIELESTPAAGTPNAVGIGNAGPLKQAMRSFRFGTSREGGTQ